MCKLTVSISQALTGVELEEPFPVEACGKQQREQHGRCMDFEQQVEIDRVIAVLLLYDCLLYISRSRHPSMRVALCIDSAAVHF